jgi:hypothetical protein
MMLLVDFENVQKLDLAAVPGHAAVRIFVGASQAKVPMALVLQAQALGARLEWIRIEGQGSNALDFHIAFYLGEYLAATPRTEYVILSRDRGFDPLVRHLVSRGFRVRRIGSQAELAAHARGHAASLPAKQAGSPSARAVPAAQAKAAVAADPGAHLATVVRNLGKVDRNRRPRRRKTLESQIAAYFQKKLDAATVRDLVDELVREGRVTIDAGGRVTYQS